MCLLFKEETINLKTFEFEKNQDVKYKSWIGVRTILTNLRAKYLVIFGFLSTQ